MVDTFPHTHSDLIPNTVSSYEKTYARVNFKEYIPGRREEGRKREEIVSKKKEHNRRSRLIVDPDNNEQRIPTVKSIDNSEEIERKLEESFIVIDFFHPSEERKREIEAKLGRSQAL